ncbi:exodeoxyribonuclease V subunit beta [Natronospira bacteriovora]|uniref:RecBCD enzyme subunit RecB n=1 Tax=Natronospira bacteriovora TaxID=3069753 RepID=A0ABU0W4N5_9GAMM|nr:exodeoxyribonuclease V subunit beta [Natronospira sp. AB-CW4]MDQ2068974.1 exodeoxyribonuclease V subunit beta [Natronospira sp. AB-CW4]
MSRREPQWERFDAATVPLHGLRLIEASAGTGKTFSLAGLYLRLLLEQWLSVREILVMTFTRAATQELRERIRARLGQAARLAMDPDSAEDDDHEQQFALTIIERVAGQRGREAVIRHLRESAARMDEATISTIHGFAQQAAAENAFDSALPFDRGEQVDDQPLFTEVISDYWRGQVVGRPADQALAFLQLWPDPEALKKDLEPVLRKPHVSLTGPDPARIDKLTARARRLWEAEGERLAELLEQCEAEQAFLKKKSLETALQRAGGAGELASQIGAGVMGTANGHVGLPDWLVQLGSDEGVRALCKKKPAESWFRPQELALSRALAEVQPLGRLGALREALAHVRETVLARKRERRKYSFNDMITGLSEAIHDEQGGPALADSLHSTWPWALVDEFQDTDPLQYAILRRIYRERERGGLLMIGDPKQAIYGFRGGDVFAYLQAVRDADARYHLDTNFRSTQSVLDAVETVFRAGGEQAFVIEDIRFQPVKAGRKAGDREIRRDGEPLPAMTLWRMDEALPKKNAEPRLIDATVHQIHQLLDGRCEVVKAREAPRPLAPADIAVLVNTNDQAAAVQQALSRRGIAAVCLHQQSVFASEEAEHLLRLLQATATPADEDALRAALATPLLGHRLGDLIRLAEDEEAWRQVTARFQQAHEAWRQAGVLAMLQPLLQDEAPRLLALEDGERRMSNYLQLAELLQQASGEQFGPDGLIDWLHRMIEDPGGDSGDDERQLRLESDDALIRIATVHKVKGLQYGIVLLPFAPLLGAGGAADKPPFLHHDEQGRACLDFLAGPGDDTARQAIAEDRAEAIRLLYVALTRAEQACYLPWGPINTAQNGALAWLLHQADGVSADVRDRSTKAPKWMTPECTAERLGVLAEQAPGAIRLEALPDTLPPDARAPRPPAPAGEARSDWPRPRPPWSVFSFTRLVRGAAHATAGTELGTGAGDEVADEQLAAAGGDIGLRGAGFGIAVHDMLEKADFADWPGPDQPLDESHKGHVEKQLVDAGLVLPDGRARQTLLEQVGGLISRCLHTQLPGIGPLAAVPATQRLAEMEFMLGLGGQSVATVMDQLHRHGYAIELPEARQRETLAGLMHGYIDLIVEADGRYYVIDYKTNDLGPDQADYAPARLRQAVSVAHYDLQYLIYCVALHRHLALRLPGYQPETHLGGVHYLFLRGMRGGEHSDGVFSDQPPTALITALDRALAGTRPEPEQGVLL